MSDTPPTLYRADALCRVTATRPDLLRRLEKASVIARSGVDEDKHPLYGEDAVTRVQRVRELLNAGYPEKDVAVVLGLVTHRKDTARRVFVTVPALVEGTAAEPGNQPGDDGGGHLSVRPDALRDDGTPMFDARRAGRLACASDLAQLGLRALADRLIALGDDTPVPAELVTQLRAAIAVRKRAVGRLARAIEHIDAGPAPRRWRRRGTKDDNRG